MKYNQLIFAVLFALLLTNCQNNKNKSIAGMWKLHKMELRDSTTGVWSEWRDGMQGYLMYDEQNNVALHLMPIGYELNRSKFRNFTDTLSIDKLKHLSMNYNYMGKYIIDDKEQIVSHLRLSHSNPNDWGVTVERRFHFAGDTLIITPVERKNSRLRLKWLRN